MGLYFSYDGANRQTAEVLRHSGGESPLDHTVLYSYDKASRRTVLSVQAGIGGSTGDGWGSEEWGDGEYGPTSGSSGWGHDAWGDSAWGGEAGSAAIPMVDYYTYDPASRLTVLHATGNGTNAAAYYEYDANSNCSQKIVSNGLITTYYGYDPANRISSIVHRKNDNSLLASLEYDYDPAGRIVRIDREAGLSLYYSYDDANRLTGEHWVDSMNATLYAFEWDYDPAGNRTRQLANVGMPNGSATYYDYNAANELTHLHVVGGSFGGIDPGHSYFQYDATGNLTQQQEPDGTTYYTYTPFNLVSTIHHKDDTWTRTWYDGNLRRYALEDPTNGLRYFTWDRNGMNLLTEQDTTGTVTRRYTHGYTPRNGIGSLVQVENPSTDDYVAPFMDHRGTVLGVVEDQGSVTNYSYNAWGFGLSNMNSGPAQTARLRFQTNWLHMHGGICLSPTRSFNPSVGCFQQRDPMRVFNKMIRMDSYFGVKYSAAKSRQPQPVYKDIIRLIFEDEDKDISSLYSYLSGDPIGYVDANGYDRATLCQKYKGWVEAGKEDTPFPRLNDAQKKRASYARCPMVITCEPCTQERSGACGIAGEEAGQAFPQSGHCDLTICTNRGVDTDADMAQTIAHEMFHCAQYCSGWNYRSWTCREALCAEIQAYKLAGDCDAGSVFRRENETTRNCLERMAISSAIKTRCRDEATARGELDAEDQGPYGATIFGVCANVFGRPNNFRK